MKRDMTTLKELIEKNKQELLKDSLAVQKIEERVEERLQQSSK